MFCSYIVFQKTESCQQTMFSFAKVTIKVFETFRILNKKV